MRKISAKHLAWLLTASLGNASVVLAQAPTATAQGTEEQPPEVADAAAEQTVEQPEQTVEQPEPSAPTTEQIAASPSEPALEFEAVENADIAELSLESLLEVDSRSGGSGGFGFRLGDLEVEPYLHGYVVAEAVLAEGSPFSFDLHYFNLFAGARIGDRVQAEIQLEHEHGEEFGIRFGQLDVKVTEWLTVRAGLFLVPFGRYNEYLYPEYLEPVPRSPLVMFMRDVVPVVWNDVGLQLRGTVALGGDVAFGYAVYAINGLAQSDDLTTPGTEDGGALRSMRSNFIDHDADKGVGFRAFLQAPTFEVGTSFYTGAYSADSRQRLYMMSADGELKLGNLLVRAEAAYVAQEAAARLIHRGGGYLRAAYTVLPQLRPAIAFDVVHTNATGTPTTRLQPVLDLDYFPWPARVPTTLFRVAGGLAFTVGNSDPHAQLIFQAVTGF